MSELREEILGGGINKKRIIGTVLIAILLIGIFAFSMTFYSFLFGSQRPTPSKEKANTDEEEALLIKPPFPFDEDFWKNLLQNFLDNFDPSLLDNLDIDNQTLADMLADLLDADLSDLDLGNFSMGQLLPLLALLGLAGAGDIEIFRVFDYNSLDNMRDALWKSECFDEYTGDGWHSTASLSTYNFYKYSNYYSKYAPDPELLKIKKEVPSPKIGINSMSIPTLFPSPFVMEGSVNAPNLNLGSTTLHKNDYNCTTLDLYFDSTEGVNMTYEMFGLHLPTDQEINSSAVKATYTPSYIKTKYLQLPPTITVYKTNNPNFKSHYDILNTIINPNDNAFVVANKIKDYLNTYFNLPMTMEEIYDYEPAPEGTDVVEWFCQTQTGLFSDFASAFCAFSRAFGVASRFVDGFNSFGIEEFTDKNEGQDCFAIKYENLYSWAEIYVPTDISGNGKWVQFDIEPLNVLGGNFSIDVDTDRLTYSRPDVIKINASLSKPVDNQRITFTDLTTDEVIGQNYTNSLGKTSIKYNLNASHVVGAHVIEAKYDDVIFDHTYVGVLGNISVILSNIYPNVVNLSDALPDGINVQGYLYDPLNGERVKSAVVEIVLLERGTSNEIIGAFNPPVVITDSNGDFDDFLDLTVVNSGQFEVRADFDGYWIINFTTPSITNSSNRLELNITKDLTPWFYIDGVPTNVPSNPRVSRYINLNLTVKVVSASFGPVPNKLVSFYDYSRGGTYIGFDISDANGLASINYFVGDYCVAGPNLLYAQIGLQKNYSYFVLNEEPTINIISGPSPRVINRTGGGATQFNIVGEIYDSTNNSIPISCSEITLLLLKGGTDYSSYLVPVESYPYQTDSTGTFDLTFGVTPTTPPGNYTLRLDFNGTINLFSYPYPFPFNLPFLNTSAVFSSDLQIKVPATLQFSFWINGTTSDNVYSPVINRYDDLNLTAYIQYDSIPIDDGEWVDFYDVTQDNLFIGSDQTNSGLAQVTYSTGWSTTAGPHLIYATWNNNYNYSYFILDAPIIINLDICPEPRNINRSGVFGRNFLIHGYLNDSLNGNSVKYGSINVHLYDGPTDVSFYLNLELGSLQLGTSGIIDLTYSVSDSTPTKNYTLHVDYNGIFTYTNPNYPQSFDLSYIANFSDSALGFYNLRVFDPDDVNIYFFIDGTPTKIFYSDGNLPQRYSGIETINFSVYVIQYAIPVNSGIVTFTDIYTGLTLGTPSVSNGFASILADTTSWHGGLHRIEVQWSGSVATNNTYVIINKTANIFASINQASIIRNIDNFIVDGTLRDNGELLRGLVVNIRLLDDTFSDVSVFYLNGITSITTDALGHYQFDNSIDLGCPQGKYYIRIDFNGSINAPGISLSDYMIHNSSLLISINILADTYIIGNYETKVVKNDWYYSDACYVHGYLYWDNGSAITGMEINVTIRDGTGAILATQTDFTDGSGFFNITFIVGDWPDDTEVWVNFYPEDPDNFGILDGLYIISTEQEVNRQT